MTDEEVLREAAKIMARRDRLGCAAIAAEEADAIAAERARAADPVAQVVEALRAIMQERWSPAGRSEHVSDMARAALAAYDAAQREAGR